MINKIQLILIIIMVLVLSSCSTGSKTVENPADAIIKNVSAKEAYELVMANKENPDFVIIDFRMPMEYEQILIEGAINIDYFDDNFDALLDDLDRNKIYLIYCEIGTRTIKVIDIMRDMGFREVYNIENGFTEWFESDYPVK